MSIPDLYHRARENIETLAEFGPPESRSWIEPDPLILASHLPACMTTKKANFHIHRCPARYPSPSRVPLRSCARYFKKHSTNLGRKWSSSFDHDTLTRSFGTNQRSVMKTDLQLQYDVMQELT